MEVLTEPDEKSKEKESQEQKQGNSFSDLKPADPADDLPF